MYVLNPSNGEADTPWVTNGNAYPDNEICGRNCHAHGFSLRREIRRHSRTPTTTASAGYAAVPKMAWKWTRINLKTNRTSSGTTNTNTVDGNNADLTQVVCWNGVNEVTTAFASCALRHRATSYPSM